MKRYIFLFFIVLTCSTQAQTFTNKGKEFWVGYGHNQLFTQPPLNTQEMVLYLSAEQQANVTVSVNGTSWVRNYVIPANTVMPTDLIPKQGADDCRILDEGLYTRGIHIVSDVPIVAYAHTYGQYSSGGTMLLPVESYSYTYFSVNSEQSFGEGSFSWFYVVASENNTKVKITPSRPTFGGRPVNVPFEISLNKGEMYNVMGGFQNQVTTYDVSGSKIQSIPGDDGICHPVGVFSGSSRTLICPGSDPFQSGSDFNMQQGFPVNAWGTKYITALTSRSTSATQLNNNKFRVYLKESNTVVRRNGAVLSGLNNNFFFDFLSTTGDIITANKPIMVAQFIPSANGCGTQGLGDPEMFYLSPVEQAINSIGFYNTNREHIEKNFVTIIIPDNGVQSLKIDGSNQFDYTYAHPKAPGYTVVVKELPIPNMQHIAKSDSNFTAITYGLGEFETYGYNAGAGIKNLEAVVQVKNEYASVFTNYTCTKTSFKPTVKTVYKPASLIWNLSSVNNLIPNADVTQANPVPQDSVTENGRKFYIYQLPDLYVFSDTGSYNIPVTITNLQIENCTYSITTNIPIMVKPAPIANFTASSTCAGDTVFIVDSSPDAASTKKWQWDFSDGTIDSVQNPSKAFAVAGTYNVTLKIIKNIDGCVGDTIKPILINELPLADFLLQQKVCMPGGEALFKNLSSLPTGNISSLSYEWNFGDGSISTDKDPKHIYAASAAYTVLLKTTTVQGCSDTTAKLLSSFVNTPIADFSMDKTAVCQGKSILFSDKSTINSSTITLWQWEFSDGTVANAADYSKLFKDAGQQSAKLIVTSAEGCVSAPISKPVTIYAQAVVYAGADVTITLGASTTLQGSIMPSSINNFNWSPAATLSNATTLNPVAKPTNTEMYFLTAIGQGNCTAKDSVWVRVIKQLYIPNSFTPNGDGFNDVWQIPGLKDYQQSKVEVYNRWGQVIYKSTGYNRPWDGFFQGAQQPAGAYYYIITPNAPGYTSLTGSVMLIR